MAWLFGGKKPSPGQVEVKAARDRQISDLHERVPSVQLKSNDGSLYEVQLRAPPDGALVMLRVFLPTKFPTERPVLQLLSQVVHPWVNQYMQVVGHPDLHGWNGANPPMIGEIVNEVIREFAKDVQGGGSSGLREDTSPWGGNNARPGYPSSQAASSAFPAGSPPYRSAATPGEVSSAAQMVVDRGTSPETSNSSHRREREARQAKASQRAPKDHTPIPAIPTVFKELKDLSIHQLNRLLEDDVARQALLLGLTSVAGMKDVRTDVRKGNVETARTTLSKVESARALREQGEGMRWQLKDLQTSYEGKAHGRNKNMGGTADQVILKQVKHASKIADTSSERVADEFLQKLIQAHVFLEEFLKERQRPILFLADQLYCRVVWRQPHSLILNELLP